jgi:hypothetical protein
MDQWAPFTVIPWSQLPPVTTRVDVDEDQIAKKRFDLCRSH